MTAPVDVQALARLERTLGHPFADTSLLLQALTHSAEDGSSQQRLEFLGDAVLGAAVSELLYRAHPEWDEGSLSVARTRLICQANLAAVADTLALAALVRTRRGVARSGPVQSQPSVLADTIEALIGAVFLDGGYAPAASAVARLLEITGAPDQTLPSKDPKTRLQEWLQTRGQPLPVYRLLGTDGPPNAPSFHAECCAGRAALSATGTGRSRKAAEQAAAADVLSQLERAHRA